jgi:DNA polymerase-3 subunit delta'
MRFANIIGQEDVKRSLIKTVKSSRVSHAQLFLGPAGVGKLPLVIAYAQYINCSDKQENDSCGSCVSCQKYEKLVHPDLHFIYPTATTEKFEKPKSKDFVADWRELLTEKKGYITLPDWLSKIGIEKKRAIINARDCNDIIRTLSYKSYEAEYKVMVIWMVEKLFHAAAPKLLKILEEPPEKTLFLLVAENQELMLKTILSRTQLVKVPLIQDEDLISSLVNQGHKPSLVNDIVRVSHGNYFEVKSQLENAEEASDNHKWFIQWMRLCWQGDVNAIVDFISKFVKNTRDTQKSMLIYGLRLMREAFLVNTQVDQITRLNSKEEKFVENFHKFIHAKNINQISEELNRSIYHIDRNANASVLFLDMSLNLNRYLKM